MRIAVAALVLALVLPGCGDADSAPRVTDAPARGGTAVLGSISDIDSWNPCLTQQGFAANLLARIYLPLAFPGAGTGGSPDAYVPALAESWSAAPDGLALTFRLRQASWSDGTPITAADVLFSHRVQTSSEVPWTGAASKEQIAAVDAVDDRTVTFRFKRRYPYQLTDAVEGVILPEHVFGAVPLALWTTHDWSTLRVGSGPFLPERHEPGQQIVLVRNPRYYRPDRPWLDRVVVRIVPDAGTLLTQLLAGEIDYVGGLAPADADRLAAKPQLDIVPVDVLQYDFIGWNGTKAPFDDPLVRRALTMAIDREALVDELLYGFGRVSKGPAPARWWGADPSAEAWPCDPAGARRVLAGRDLKLELLTNAGNRLREDVLAKVQEQLARAGVTATIRPLEMKAMRQRVAAGDYDGYLGGWVFSGKVDLKALFGSELRPPQGLNVVAYRSADADRLLAEIDAAPDWPTMRPLLAAFERRIAEDQPYTFLYESQRLAAHDRRLAGVTAAVASDALAALEEFWLKAP